MTFQHKPNGVGFALDRICRAHRLGIKDAEERFFMALIDREIDRVLQECREIVYGKPKIEVVTR